jgi:ATP-dependent Zn protease
MSDASMPTSGRHEMGPLELAVYRKAWKASRRYLRRVAAGAAERHRKPETPQKEAACATPDSGPTAYHAALAWEEDLVKAPERDAEAPMPGRVAASLLIARLFDRNPSVTVALRNDTPVVLVDVPDPLMFARIAHQWKDALSLDGLNFVKFGSISARRDDCAGISLVTNDTIPPKDRPALDARAFAAIQLALPILAITPAADVHLSAVLLDAATTRLTLPPIDASLIERTIRIVTGSRCDARIPGDIFSEVGIRELLLSVRFDRTSRDCVERLARLVAKKASHGSRDLTLDELHGLDEAVAWAKSTIADLEAWRRGEIGWDAIDAGMIMNGPPGTGKTTLANCFASEAKLPLVVMSFSKWQGAGEGHLGHLLRQMRLDFREARSKEPAACVLIDELDSMPDRNRITHSSRDYVVSVVNSLLEMVGAPGHRLIFIGCTNNVTRCDPALIRAGRFNRVIQVGLPSHADLEKMFRVRLRDSLVDEPIDEIALLASGSTGADVERIVKDARRAARQARRSMTVDDLRRAVGGAEELSEEALRRAAAHEAGHVILAVIHNGPSEVHAVIGAARGRAGLVTSYGSNYVSGTAEECRRALQILLAGRAAEEIAFDCGGGNGAGGSDRSDLASATRIAAAMVGSYGLSGPHPLVYVADHLATERLIEHRYMRTAVQAELSKALGGARTLLLRHRAAFDEVADRLLRNRTIDGFQVEEILESSATSRRQTPTDSSHAGATESESTRSP